MSSIFDFSSALPWLAAGFLAGVLLFWLIRALMGIDRSRIEALSAANIELEDARRAHASLSQTYTQLEGERSRLASETARLSQSASLIPQYERQIADLRQSDNTRASALEDAGKQLALLRDTSGQELASARQDAEHATNTAKYYETEFARLLEAHQALSKDSSANADVVNKLQADYTVAAREAGEAARLRSELASAKAEVESLRADVEDSKSSQSRYQDEVTRLRREHEQAVVAVETAKAQGTGSADEIAKLKSELATAQKRAENSDEVLKLNAEIARLRPLEVERSELAGEVARLHAELQNAKAAGDTTHLHDEIANLRFAAAESQSLADEVTRLRAELASVATRDPREANYDAEIARLKASASAEAASYSDEIERIKSEMAKLNAALVSARADERSAAMDLHAAKNDLQQARIAMEETSRLVAERHAEIEQLKGKLASMPADIDNYRRFKEALDAANRIAAGLPEKS